MARDTLLDFFDDRVRSDRPFLVYDDGYRSYRYTYAEIRHAAGHLAARLATAGIGHRDAVVVWGENRAEWIVAFWGCLLRGAVVVPIDARASAELLTRVARIVDARLVMADRELVSTPTGVDRWPLDALLVDESLRAPPASLPPRPALSSDDLAEIIFTSGATADPKGVEITHGNVLANIVPVEREVQRYVAYGRPFFPLRFLNLLPLSHMFGQAMATFVPPMLQGVTVFVPGYNPERIVRTIRTLRISVLVCVPRILGVLQSYVAAVHPELGEPAGPPLHVVRRWWRYRRVHRLFGFKFWAFVVGGAPLDPELESVWSRFGFLVIQGYGLTETAPIVTLNHPFRTRRGSVGAPIGGVELKIADDGEILVRGGNVTRGYHKAPDATTAAFRDGWFHTGDIGTIDAGGRLTVRGRKKEMIVTPDGLNVFPEDVEQVIRDAPGVRDVAVVAAADGPRERVHAVLALEPNTDPDAVVQRANAVLEEHQRVRAFSVWPDPGLPRTAGTEKLKRQALKQWVDGHAAPPVGNATSPDRFTAVVSRFTHGRTVSDDTTLETLGLSSLERIELLLALEQVTDRTVDETMLDGRTTIGALKTALTEVTAPAGRPPDAIPPSAGRPPDAIPPSAAAGPPIAFPTWSQGRGARAVRRLALPLGLLPLTRLFVWTTVEGVEHVERLGGPVLYAANHQSALDAPAILAALPPARRYTVATAAALEWFAAHFHPARYAWWQRRLADTAYYLGVLHFNIVPLPQREAGTRDAMRYLGTLLQEGTSVLIFPEGQRRAAGDMAPFQPGVGMLACTLQVPVVPVHLDGLDRIWPVGRRLPRPGRARVRFGPPARYAGRDYRLAARRIETAVTALRDDGIE